MNVQNTDGLSVNHYYCIMNLNKRPRWLCSWKGEEGDQCEKCAQSNGRRLCQRHFCQYEERQWLRAATEPAGINTNDAPAPVGNIAVNNNDDEQLIDAANVENIGNHANNNYPPDVVDDQSNDAAAPICTIADIDNNDRGINVDTAPVRYTADSRDNYEQLNDAVNNDRCEVADGQLIEAVVGNGNIETHYAAIGNEGTPFTINYLNDQLELRDKRIRELEAKIVDLERKMTALSETIGDWNCNSVGSDSRFSHFSGLWVKD